MTRFALAVSLARAIRPILNPLNRELTKRNAHSVTREEWPVLDDVLHEGQSDTTTSAMRCSYCGGYLNAEAEDGEFSCLNCARSSSPRREVGQLVEKLALRLMEYRSNQD